MSGLQYWLCALMCISFKYHEVNLSILCDIQDGRDMADIF